MFWHPFRSHIKEYEIWNQNLNSDILNSFFQNIRTHSSLFIYVVFHLLLIIFFKTRLVFIELVYEPSSSVSNFDFVATDFNIAWCFRGFPVSFQVFPLVLISTRRTRTEEQLKHLLDENKTKNISIPVPSVLSDTFCFLFHIFVLVRFPISIRSLSTPGILFTIIFCSFFPRIGR